MESLNDLYTVAAQMGVETHAIRCPHAKGISCVIDQIPVIGLDRSLFKNEAAERLVLAHELGHAATGAYYERPENPVHVRRMEWKAQKWTLRRLVPEKELAAALHEDVTPYELAQQFDVPEDMIKQAMWLYFKKEIE